MNNLGVLCQVSVNGERESVHGWLRPLAKEVGPVVRRHAEDKVRVAFGLLFDPVALPQELAFHAQNDRLDC